QRGRHSARPPRLLLVRAWRERAAGTPHAMPGEVVDGSVLPAPSGVYLTLLVMITVPRGGGEGGEAVDVGLGGRDLAAGHHGPSDLDELVEAVLSGAGVGDPGEGGDGAREGRGGGVHGAGAGDCAGHDAGADRGLDVVAEDAAEEGLAGAFVGAVGGSAGDDLAVGVEEVGVGGGGAEVDPLADPGVAEVAVV